MATRILVADDHEIVLEGIRTLLTRSGRDWEICGEARNGQDAVELANSLNPDIIVLDITMPVMSGLEAATRLSRAGKGRILIFTMHESQRLEAEVRAAGAQGYVLKSEAARDLIRAIEHLLAGDNFFGAPPQKQEIRKANDKQTPDSIFFRSIALSWA
jgi:DNA-binding NarL/FixJ family response regulator